MAILARPGTIISSPGVDLAVHLPDYSAVCNTAITSSVSLVTTSSACNPSSSCKKE